MLSINTQMLHNDLCSLFQVLCHQPQTYTNVTQWSVLTLPGSVPPASDLHTNVTQWSVLTLPGPVPPTYPDLHTSDTQRSVLFLSGPVPASDLHANVAQRLLRRPTQIPCKVKVLGRGKERQSHWTSQVLKQPPDPPQLSWRECPFLHAVHCPWCPHKKLYIYMIILNVNTKIVSKFYTGLSIMSTQRLFLSFIQDCP